MDVALRIRSQDAVLGSPVLGSAPRAGGPFQARRVAATAGDPWHDDVVENDDHGTVGDGEMAMEIVTIVIIITITSISTITTTTTTTTTTTIAAIILIIVMVQR